MDRLYKRFVKETLENGLLKSVSFDIPDNFNFGYDVIDELGRRSPNKRALVWVSETHEERIFTFSELSSLTSRVANYFTSIGIKKGDKVLLILKKHYQFWLSIIALHKLGAIAIPATNQLMKKDIVYRCNSADVDAVLCTATGIISDEVDAARSECTTVKHYIMIAGDKEGWISFDREYMDFSDKLERVDTKANELMLMYFTSGTTGYPRIAAHSHTYAIGHVLTAVWWHNVDPDGLHFTTSDTGWGKAAWGKLYGQWLAEGAVFVYDYDRFNAEDMMPLFAKYGITTFCAPPTIFRFLIKCDLSKYDLSNLKYATNAGEALNPEVFKQFYAATGIRLMEGFGQTETTLTVANLVGMEPKPGSMGKPSPQYQVSIMDLDGSEARRGQTGEIVIKADKPGEQVGLFMGYYLHDKIDEEQTAQYWHDGYYHTGDVAWQDEDGYLWFYGRTDDVIKSSGYRIGPFEIESILMEHPAVLECAITGVPDKDRGQIVKATIVLAQGYEPSEELKTELQQFVKHLTAPYKYPRRIDFVDSLPKTISGKIRRVELKE